MSRTRSLIAVVLALLAASGTAIAQQGRIHGAVVDGDGNPIVGVRVELEPTAGGAVKATTVTNRRGNYLFGLVLPGTYRMRVASGDKALAAVRGEATDASTSSDDVVWTFDGTIAGDGSFEIEVEDGWAVTCDLMLGEAVRIAGEGGEETIVAPDAALDALTRRVQSGDCAGALAGLDTLAAATPDVAKVHYLLGYCLGSEGRGEEAVGALGRALEIAPGFPGAALLEGEILMRLGRSEEAMPLFEREIETAANDALVSAAWAQLGILHREAGRDREAVAAFEKVVERDPSRTEVWADLATLYTSLDRLDDAERALSRAAEGGRVDPAALLNIGINYFNSKDFDNASRTLSRVVELGDVPKKELGLAYALLGQCQLRAGQRERAIASLEKSLAIAPDGEMAADTRETLKSLGR